MELPLLDTPLTSQQLGFLKAFSKSCRRSILEMTSRAQSGHPGGSLSSLDYLSVLYSFIITQTGEKVVVSNGHISPAVYSVLAELGYIPKEEVIAGFRKNGSPYEGHVARLVPGVEYGTGPLGIGVSVASGFALAEKLKKSGRKVYGLMGDGEAQEGQIHEMIHFSRQYALDNFILFIDYNKVQLSASFEEILPIDLRALFEAGGWEVLELEAHDYQDIWAALGEAHDFVGKPVVLIGHSVMGKGIDFMEMEGLEHKATWHGNAPKPEQVEEVLGLLTLTEEEQDLLESFRRGISWRPESPKFSPLLQSVSLKQGTPMVYPAGTVMDCRSAYGKALLDLAQNNSNVLALTADLRGSVMTQSVHQTLPLQHIECGIAEQHMVSLSGGLSLSGFIPFCSTFGAFMTSRAKDQARVNDINKTNVKMVATHCGLSVGEDGPTHQAIDDMGSFLGFFNTLIIEPVDANQTDRIIRYIASHYGNFYVRMGRHKFAVVETEEGAPFFDENYEYRYGRCDVIRQGKDLTLAALGGMTAQAIQALTWLKKNHSSVSVELVAVSSPKVFDETLIGSIEKTKKVITLEDHNTYSGMGAQLARHLEVNGIQVECFEMLGVEAYQLSGKWNELYQSAGLSPEAIGERCVQMVL